MKALWLASGSPRRAELLSQLGLEFRLLAPQVDETTLPGENALAYVSRMSSEKASNARQFLAAGDDGVVLCADTIVVVDGRILGKPQDQPDAIAMLQSLSGREHQVVTSVTIFDHAREKSFQSETIVAFRPLTIRECENYWLTGEPHDKAGGYGIQGIGAIFVESISGSYSNVVGLPLAETARTLQDFGIDCLAQAAARMARGKELE